MAGGEGSRLRLLTCARPKPMVPIVNRPCRFTGPGSGQPDFLAGRGMYRLLVTDENNKSLDEQLAGETVSATTGGNQVYDVLFSAARLPDATKQLIITPLVRKDWLIARLSEGSPLTTISYHGFTDPLGTLAIERPIVCERWISFWYPLR
jgi:hypothetical protein